MPDLRIGTVKDGYRYVGGTPGDPSSWQKLPPAKGSVQGGYKFLGGDPADPASWQKQKEDAGFWGSFKEGLMTLGAADEAAAYAANPTEANRRALIKAGESEYNRVGFGEGRNFEAFLQTAGGSLGQLVAPITAGIGASFATTPLGGLATASAVSGSQYTTQNLLRQAQEQEAAIAAGKKPEETSVGKALVAAAGQTGLDVLGGAVFGKVAKAFPFMRPLFGEAGKKATQKAGAVLEDAVANGTVSFTGNVARGVGKGVAFEVPQEIAQQALERWQAGLSLSDDSAVSEYKQAAIGAVLLGGGFGAVAGAVSPRTQAPQTEEEISNARQSIEQAIEDTGIPEAQDPEIKARAAFFVQNSGTNPRQAVIQALSERDERIAMQRERETSGAAEELDLGGREPDVSGVSGPDVTGEPTGTPTGAGRGTVGGTGLPAGQPVAGEGDVKSPLEPQGIIPPVEAISPEVQFAQQMAAVQAAQAPAPQVAPQAAPTVEEAAPVAPPPVAEEAAPLEAKLTEYGNFTQQGQVAPPELVKSIAADVLNLVETNKLNEFVSGPQGVLAQQFFANEAATVNELANQKAAVAPEEQVAPETEEAPPTVAETATLENVAPVEVAPVVEETAAIKPAKVVKDKTGAVVGGAYTTDQILNKLETSGVDVESLINPAETAPAVELPPEVVAAQAEVDKYNPGYEIRYNEKDGRRRYSFGLPGRKSDFASPNLNSVKTRALNAKPVQPKQVIEGVPVKQLAPGNARGLEKPKREMQLQPEKPSVAGKLSRSQEQEQSLTLFEIDEARKGRAISNAERTELLNMLRTPEGKDLARSREWTLAAAIQNDLDTLTQEGKQLRSEERLAKEQKALTPEKQKEFAKRAKDIAKRTKEQEARLAEAKIGVYQRTRAKLNEFKKARQEKVSGIRKAYQERVAQLDRNLKRKLITQEVYNTKLREAQNRYKQALSEARPEPIMFRQAKGEPAGVTLEALNSAVKDVTSRWGARLEPKMVQSVQDLPASIRAELEAKDRLGAYGFYKNGKAYLIADNMDSIEDVAPTLYHEALGHLGLRAKFQDGLDRILTDIYRTNKRVADIANNWLSANEGLYEPEENPVARAVEEVLATASEKGPLSASRFDKLVNYLKEFARQYLGLDFKFSDREVHTILAMAHEHALSGEGTVMGNSSMMFNSAEENEAVNQAARANMSAQDFIDEVITTTADRRDPENYSKGIFSRIGDAIKSRNYKNSLKAMERNSFSRGFVGRGGLKFLPTDGMLAYAKTKLGDNIVTRELDAANDAMVRMNSERATMRRHLSKLVREVKDYLNTTGNNSMVNAMDYGTYNNMNMMAFKDGMTLEEGYKTDGIWRRYNKLLQNKDLDAKTRAEYQGNLEKRQKQIEGGMILVSKVDAQGRRLYERVRDTHRAMYERRQYLMKEYIKSLKDAGMSQEAVDKLMVAYRQEQERLKDTENAPAPEDANQEYPEVPLGMLHREYFPKRRYGQYYLRIKKTKFGQPILRFYDTMAERDADWDEEVKKTGPNTKFDQNYYVTGNNVEMDYHNFEGINTNTAFNKALNLISDINTDTFTEAKKRQLQNDVYQLLLLSTPEGTGRKQFIKSKNRLGWSSDIIRALGATAEEYATDVTRLEYGPQVDRALNSARSAVDPTDKGPSVPTDVAELSRDFINDLQARITGSMEPQTESLVNKIVPWMNSWAYIAFLTAPATAIIQPIALGLNVAPHLGARYGYGAMTKAMARYMNVFTNRPKFEGADTEGRKSFRMLTLLESNKLKNSKRHRQALISATNEYGIIMPMSEFTMYDERTPQTATENRKNEVVRHAYDAMTYLFDTTEQLTREVTFMATYDLEYDKLADAGLSAEERQQKAIIAAKDVVNNRLGDYSNLNRAPFMKNSQIARAVFLFKQYAVTMTKFFVESARSIFGPLFGGKTSRADQVIAMKEVTGVLAMGFLIGGLKGMPLYGLGMMALQGLQDLFDDDDDRRERMKQNPITADSVELQFKYEWLPSHFGPQTVRDKNNKEVALTDIMLNGPVSELTGWNFGSRVSLDLAGMWFRMPKEGNNWAETVNNALVENIAGASATLGIVKMGEEISKGEVVSGLENGMPAFLKAWAKAYRLGSEGLRTSTGDIKVKAEDLSNAEIVGTAIGFNPMQIAKAQERSRDVLNRTKKLQEGKTELLTEYKAAVQRIQNGDADGQEEARKAFQKIVDYNKKIGNVAFAITYANILRSLRGAAAEDKYDIEAINLNQVESYYAKKMFGTQ